MSLAAIARPYDIARMLSRLLNAWDYVRTSLWFVPTLMVVMAGLLALLAIRADGLFASAAAGNAWWMLAADREVARDTMSTLASAMIAMTTVVLSITMVVLTLAASQFGTRLIRSFMADWLTQIAIGILMMTIVYSLMVLGAMGSGSSADVPNLAVIVGLSLALLSVLTLVLFIHHIARSIMADSVIARVGAGLDDQIAALERLHRRAGERPAQPPDPERPCRRVGAPWEGYVQLVQYESLIALAERHDVLLRLAFNPGAHIIRGQPVIAVYPDCEPSPKLLKGLKQHVVVGRERTPTQDLEFAIRHLVELAERALSPGINDSYTAISVLDRMSASLARLMARRLRPDMLCDAAGKPRLLFPPIDHEALIDTAFHQIRQSAQRVPSVMIHMLDVIGALAPHARLPEQRRVLADHAAMIEEVARRTVAAERDRVDLDRHYRRALAALSEAATAAS